MSVNAKPKPPPEKPRPERACAACGKRFKPTVTRRMLCNECYRRGHGPTVI